MGWFITRPILVLCARHKTQQAVNPQLDINFCLSVNNLEGSRSGLGQGTTLSRTAKFLKRNYERIVNKEGISWSALYSLLCCEQVGTPSGLFGSWPDAAIPYAQIIHICK